MSSPIKRPNKKKLKGKPVSAIILAGSNYFSIQIVLDQRKKLIELRGAS